LATLDAGFDVRVWDLNKTGVVDHFPAPVGGFFAHNSAIAISHDGSLLAYASAGKLKSEVLLRDVGAKADVCRWELPGGFDFLATAGPDEFLLVREEIQPDISTVRTAAHVIRRDQRMSTARPIRESASGDESSFLKGQLTPDGRYYLWVGPRQPDRAKRVEVWDVKAGRLIAPVPTRPVVAGAEPAAYLDPFGRYVWVSDSSGPRRYELAGHSPPKPVTALTIAASEDAQRVVLTRAIHPNWHGSDARLSKDSGVRDWLLWANYDNSGICPPAFSPIGGWLAAGTGSGLVIALEFDAFQQAVDAFEAELQSVR